ncbi:hypothetical protein FRX31_009747 [Thalictrum thalictroides]|uniref:Uncharacterized protein n=1 Tax=Thalictrum thalictroides TaxID=46969 RepID=A0A7J6WVW0_THATH|nr:hypothetical protein FRX31_009747 [Thalictrum thalictroides]
MVSLATSATGKLGYHYHCLRLAAVSQARRPGRSGMLIPLLRGVGTRVVATFRDSPYAENAETPSVGIPTILPHHDQASGPGARTRLYGRVLALSALSAAEVLGSAPRFGPPIGTRRTAGAR